MCFHSAESVHPYTVHVFSVHPKCILDQRTDTERRERKQRIASAEELQEKMEAFRVSHLAVTATRLTQLPMRKLGSFQQCRRSVGVPGMCRAEAGDVTNSSSVAAERPLWLPGSTPPAYLNGS